MVKLLLSYVNELEADSKAAVLAQWTAPNVNDPRQKACLDEKNLTLRKKYYQFLQPLVDVIARDSCPNRYFRLSEETEKELGAFRQTMLPEAAVKLDDYYDIEQLLIAAYETYAANFNVFQSWAQQCVFSVKVIGFIQSLVTPELGKVFCAGAWNVVHYHFSISKRAENLLLDENVSYYRTSRDYHNGLGGRFLAHYYYPDDFTYHVSERELAFIPVLLQNYVEQKNKSLADSYNIDVTENISPVKP